MPIDQTITAFPAAPNAGSDTPEEFSNKADAFVAHQSDNYVGEVNTWATEANATASDVNDDATTSGTNATNAAASAVLANEWAENPEDDPVVAGEYSALHWAAKAAAVPVLNPDVNTLQIAGEFVSAFNMKNKLINGAMDIWQRDTDVTDPAIGYNTADRWANSAAASVGGTLRILRNVGPTRNAMYIIHTGATSPMGIWQNIEDLRLKAKTVSISFDCQLTGSTEVTVGLALSEGGVLGPKTTQTQIIPANSGRYTFEDIVVPTSSTPLAEGDFIEFSITYNTEGQGAPSDATYRFWNIQLEEGTTSTPFEYRPIALELSLCQRYYWKGYPTVSGYSYSTAASNMLFFNQTFSTTMRVDPTFVVETEPTYDNCSGVQLFGNTNGFNGRGAVTADGVYRATSGEYSANAEI